MQNRPDHGAKDASMADGASPRALHEPRIEPRWRLLESLKPVWPWAHRTYHRDLGLRGPGDLVRHHWTNATFDRKYGVRTEFRVAPKDLGIEDAELVAHAARYRGTPPFSVATSLKRLSERLGGLGGDALVDYGSGAGRVLILSAEAGVGKVIGLEMSPDLVAQMQRNFDIYRARKGAGTDFEVLQQDATRYIPPPDVRLFYFFCPFSLESFDRAVDGIRQSVREHPRTIYLMLFMDPGYRAQGLDLIGDVTGVQTYTNALAPKAFLSQSD